jgi:hypothetical protein
MDKRTSVYRQTAELISALEADQGRRRPIHGQLQLIESAGSLRPCGAIRGALVSGRRGGYRCLCTVSNSERTYETVGLSRVAKDHQPGRHTARGLHRG